MRRNRVHSRRIFELRLAYDDREMHELVETEATRSKIERAREAEIFAVKLTERDDEARENARGRRTVPSNGELR